MRQVRVDHQPAYVLHTQPYRETSLLVEVLSRDHGRFSLVARGARRPRSDLRGLLLPFQPLQLSWFGKGELRTLHVADWRGGVPQFAGERLVCGYYLNELLMRLVPREDPAEDLFALYDRAIRQLAQADRFAGVLRRFELQLLQWLGYSPLTDVDSNGEPLRADGWYDCQYGHPPQPAISGLQPGPRLCRLSGTSLLAMQASDWASPQTRKDARQLARLYLDELLGPEPLASRELLTTLYALAE